MALDDQMNMFEETDDMGLMQEGGDVDPVSGNEVPLGGTQEGVRDDVEANVSEGEMVIPEDVVRYFGVEHFMRLRDEAKMGYKKMDAMGQMGNPDEASIPDDAMFNPGGMPFSVIDMEYVDEEEGVEEAARYGGMPAYHGGGYNPNASYQDNQLQTQMPSYQTGGVVPSTTFLANQPSSTVNINPATGQPVTTPPASPLTTPATLPQVSAATSTPSTLTLSSPVATPTISGAAAPPVAQAPLPRIGAITGGAQSFRFFRNEEGQTIQIPVINGRQVFEAPEGFSEFNPDDPFVTPAVPDTADAATEDTTTTTRPLSDAEKARAGLAPFDGGRDASDVNPDTGPEDDIDPDSVLGGLLGALGAGFGPIGVEDAPGIAGAQADTDAAEAAADDAAAAAAAAQTAADLGVVGQDEADDAAAAAAAAAATAEATASVTNAAADLGIDAGEGTGGDSKVICTELTSKGLLDKDVYKLESEYADKYISEQTMLGYHLWAVPVVKLMRKSTIVTNCIKPFATAWANEVVHSYKPDLYKKGSLLGKVIVSIGVPICHTLGWFVSTSNYRTLYEKENSYGN